MRICLGSDKKNRVLVEEAARLVRAAGGAGPSFAG